MYNRKPNRLKEYNYSQNGMYFVTVCVKDRVDWFGEIKNTQMILNEYGKIAQKQWNWLSEQYLYMELDTFVIMPNHFHGVILIVGNDRVGNGNGCVGDDNGYVVGNNVGNNDNVGNGRDRSLHKIKPLPELIGAFKTTSSKLIHNAGGNEFHWQKSFYDHIIRDELSLNRIREYIINNPRQWDSDVENAQVCKTQGNNRPLLIFEK